MSGVSKLTADRNQRILLDLVNKPGNDVCADCKARTPRWASHNLGIFLCMNCASIHRKIGTHITKVKSITMDAWTKEQVEIMKSTGNVASNAKFNPNEILHPPPANREESERDSELEKFIRYKYEFKRFMEKSPTKPQSASVPQPTRAKSTPAVRVARPPSPPPAPVASEARPPSSHIARPVSASTTSTQQQRSMNHPSVQSINTLPANPTYPHLNPFLSNPPANLATSSNPHANPPVPSALHANPPPPLNPVWEDMLSLARPPTGQFQQSTFVPPTSSGNPYVTASPFPSRVEGPLRSVSLPLPGSAPVYVQPQTGPLFVGNQLNTSPQPPGFASQAAPPSVQQGPLQNQSSTIQTQFAQPLQPQLTQAGQALFPYSYAQSSPAPQLQSQPEFGAGLLPQTQAHGYQQQLAPQGNPFASWSQQQAGFAGQQHAGPVQPTGTGFAGQQNFAPWSNM